MINITFDVEDEDFLRELAQSEREIAALMAETMEQVGYEVVSFLRSLTSETRPPARPGEPNRRAHPGGWADITSNLANAYAFELYAGGEMMAWTQVQALGMDSEGKVAGVRVLRSGTKPKFPLELKLLNGMDYAAALEARDGYWVIREITGKGGPVARALRNVLRTIAPDAQIQGIS